MAELPLRTKTDAHDTPLPFGKELLKEFLIDPAFRNLNNGSFGSCPRVIRDKQIEYQRMYDARPDPFGRHDFAALLDESRAAVAALLNAPVEGLVMVANASTGANAVLRGLPWNADGLDEILHFDTAYAGVASTIDYVVDSSAGHVTARPIELEYPAEDADIVEKFRAAVAASRAAGRRPRLAVFDVVSSSPAVCFPYKAVAAVCRDEGVLSLVDGAQGVGMVALDVAALDPDFFVSNCHKWLHTPRSCAVLYVPERNQHLVPSALPTNTGYAARSGPRVGKSPRFAGRTAVANKSRFVYDFEFNGTVDTSTFLCTKDAIAWRRDVLGGEERIRAYQTDLARKGGRRMAEILRTRVIDNATGTLSNCAMTMVELPLGVAGSLTDPATRHYALVPADRRAELSDWLHDALVRDYATFVPLMVHRGRWWGRLSAQVYLDLDDFEWAGQTLKDLCARAAQLDYVRAPEAE